MNKPGKKFARKRRGEEEGEREPRKEPRKVHVGCLAVGSGLYMYIPALRMYTGSDLYIASM